MHTQYKTITWEQRELQTCCEITTGKLDANAMVEDGKYDFYTSGIATYKINIAEFKGPAITIAGNGATVGYMHLADGEFNAYQRTYVLSKFNKSRLFLYYVIGSKLPIKIKEEARASNIPYIVMDMLEELEIPSTISSEEEKLGMFFNNLESLITLHQRKCDRLKKVKQGLLEKMFPTEKEDTPKIRFKGFTEPWEQRKYEDIGTCLSGGSLSYASLSDDGKYKCVLYGDLYTLYDTTILNVERRTNYKGNTIFENDILFPQSTTVDAYSLISPACLNEKTAETSGVFVIRPDQSIDGNFIAYYSKGNESQRNKLAKNAQGLTIVHLYYQSIKDETILIPSFEEQIKISNLLMKLDSLITLHQRKCEKLKNIKSALLDRMFV